MNPHPFQYVVLRCVPRVDREEFINVGVVLHCDDSDFLAAEFHVDEARARALFCDLDFDALKRALEGVQAVCRGDVEAWPAETSHAASSYRSGARFRWLAAPRSTVVQPGPVRSGITVDPGRQLHLLARAVLPGFEVAYPPE